MSRRNAKLVRKNFRIEIKRKRVCIKLLFFEEKTWSSLTNDEIDDKLDKFGLRDATFTESRVWGSSYHKSYLGHAIAARGKKKKGNKARRSMVFTSSGSTQDEPGYWEPLVEYREVESWSKPWTGEWLFLVVKNQTP